MSTINHTTPGDTPQLTNGQVAKHVNGHGQESAPAAAPPSGSAKRLRSRAASDDAHGTPVAPAPAPPAAASATHDACADAARDSSGKQAEQNHAGSSARGGTKRPEKEPPTALPPGELPFPELPYAFLRPLHQNPHITHPDPPPPH